MRILFAGLRRLATYLRLRFARSVVSFGSDLHVGRGCRFWAPSGIVLGSHTYIGRDVQIEANASIGSYVLIANRVAIVGRHDHDFTVPGVPVRFGEWVGRRSPPSKYANETAIIEDDVWIGFAAIVMTDVRIGRGAVVAAGAVVVKDVGPYQIVAGCPAKVVGLRFADAEVIRQHEKMIAGGRFIFSEQGFHKWIVQPGSPNLGSRL